MVWEEFNTFWWVLLLENNQLYISTHIPYIPNNMQIENCVFTCSDANRPFLILYKENSGITTYKPKEQT